ncbi:hypothetical protein [Saccharothrix sp.]|uniref:hypothetical protein n=1 Tax=Saccharothrix sp. TaxID=1873460 RepID=UPI0028119D2B|nr:hypothetical protein [Saccharothrix sp.]
MRWLWLVSGLVVVAVGVGVFWLGLEKADQVASVVGALAGVAGLAVALYGLRRTAAPPAAVSNTVANSTVHGPNIQIGSAGGNVEVHEKP